MADVLIVAPIVKFEGDDWNDCREFVNSAKNQTTTTDDELELECRCRRFLDSLNGAERRTTTSDHCLIDWASSSAAATVVGSRCLCLGSIMAPRNNRETSTDNSHGDNLLIWNQVQENYDNLESQKLIKKSDSVLSEDLGNVFGKIHQLSDDEEGAEAMEMSILSAADSPGEEPIKSADEVINEIVEMMEDDLESEFELCCASLSKSTEALKTKLQNMKQADAGLSANLQEMPIEDINALQEELDMAIKDYSEVLLCQLVLREELVFQRELFNQFISLLLSIQKKRRTLDADRRKGRTATEPPTYKYLTTVIPYDDHQKTPDADLLQIYIKILQAIDEDNSKVPTLLTDYILNVLCPKS